MINLSDLPQDHVLRNTLIKDLPNLRCCNKVAKNKQTPCTWKIKNNTYNELAEFWKTLNNWIIT